MQEKKKLNNAGKQTAKKDDRLADATSGETLSDVESSQESSANKSNTATSVEGAESVTPDSVSGNDGRGRADGSDTGGPM